jgi:hypothetical protein
MEYREYMNLPTIRLAHFVPFEDIDLSHSTKFDLIINALLLSNSAMDVGTIKNYIASQFGCELEESLLDEILQQMVKSSHVDKIQNTYNLSYSIYVKLRGQIDEILVFQDKVINDWCNNIILPKYDHIQEGIIEELKRRLPEFLSNLFLEHGADSRALIEQSVQKSHENAHTIMKRIIFDHDESKRIAQIEFISFLSSVDANSRRYLEILIEKAFRYLTTVCDPEVFEAIKKSINGKILFLDSSTVYRLVNLQGESRHQSTKEVIMLCLNFGFKLFVSAMTLKELYRRIDFDSRVLLNHPTPTNLSAIGYSFMTEENFVSTFWRENRDSGIGINDYLTKYKSIDVLLESLGVEVEKELPNHNDLFNEEWRRILSQINSRNDHEKSALAADHDAYLIALMDYLRKDLAITRFLDNPAWILTTDQFLIRFQRSEYSFKDKTPFAILPSQLIQILRFVKPKDNKFNEMFLDVFSKSFNPISNGLKNESIQYILARISQYSGYTPTLAGKVLSDQLFRNKYNASHSDGEKEEIIHEAIVEKANELEVLIMEKDNELVELKTQINAIIQGQDLLKQQIEVKDTQIIKSMEELEHAQRETAGVTLSYETLAVKLEHLDRENKAREQREAQMEILNVRRLKRKRLYKNLLLQISYIICVVLLVSYRLEIFPSENKLLKSIGMSILIMGIAPLTFFIYEDKKHATIITTSIGLLFTISAWAYGIL